MRNIFAAVQNLNRYAAFYPPIRKDLIMGLITGYLCLICLILLLVKFVTRKCGFQKMNRTLAKIHKPVSYVFLVLMLVHLVLTLPVFKTRELSVFVSGFLMLGLCFLILILCHVQKKAKTRMFWHHILSLGMIIAVVVHIVVYFTDFTSYLSDLENIEIQEVDLSQIADGTYEGEHDIGYIYARAAVTVKNHEITDVKLLEHNHERGIRAEENLPGKIVAEQTIKTDAISGATNSSKVIMKACENALSRKAE